MSKDELREILKTFTRSERDALDDLIISGQKFIRANFPKWESLGLIHSSGIYDYPRTYRYGATSLSTYWEVRLETLFS